MRVLVVSGIWPPDVGGPASHAPEVASFLLARGHSVEVVTTADSSPDRESYRIRSVSRRLPKGAIHAAATGAIARAARRADVVYTTGMYGRTAAACLPLGRPYVVKLTGDPAFERARWRRRVDGDVESFQRRHDHRAVRRLRDITVRRAAHVVCPSVFLRGLVLGWGVDPGRISVLPNPAPHVGDLRPRDPRREGDIVLAFAGRIGPQKALHVALDAVARLEGVRLLVAGDGELRSGLEAQAGPNVQFLGSLSRKEVLELFAGADALVSSSAWENFPHTVVEALATGTPVIATCVGGVPEVVEDGVNGLLVPPGNPDALAAAIQRFARDDELRTRLASAAAPSAARFSAETLYGELERILVAVTR